MVWSEVIVLIGVIALLGVPVLGFTLYWIARLLEPKEGERRQSVTTAEAKELRARLAELQVQLDQVRGSEGRLAAVEEQIAFMECLLQSRDVPLSLPLSGRERRS